MQQLRLRPVFAALVPCAVCLLVAATACDGGPSDEQPPATEAEPTIGNREPTELELPIHVAVTLPLFQDFVRAAGKENVEVVSVLPAGTPPHGYDPQAAAAALVSTTRFFFHNGLGLDERLAERVEADVGEQTYVVPFAPNIRSPRGSELGNPDITAEQAGDNPHLWLDPMLAYVYVEIVADEFVIYDGVRQTYYDDNFAAYRDEMVRLRDELSAELAKIPEGRRKLVTYHDSFEHFGRRFGLEVSGFAVAEPGAVPDAAAIDALVGKIQSEGIPAVFAEHGYDEAVMTGIGSRAGVEVCKLYTDILPEGVDTYVEMMRRNVAEIVRCLGG